MSGHRWVARAGCPFGKLRARSLATAGGTGFGRLMEARASRPSAKAEDVRYVGGIEQIENSGPQHRDRNRDWDLGRDSFNTLCCLAHGWNLRRHRGGRVLWPQNLSGVRSAGTSSDEPRAAGCELTAVS